MLKELKTLEVRFDPKEQRNPLVHRLVKAMEFLVSEPKSAKGCWVAMELKDIAYILSCIETDEFLEDRYD